MDPATPEDGAKLFKRAVELLSAGETPSALAFLERALKEQDNPAWYSYLGFCIAKERGQLKKGGELCHTSLEIEPDNPVHYLNLARIHVIAKKKDEALATLRKGMAAGGNVEIQTLLATLGVRKPPVLKFLSRDHLLNKWLGILLSRIGLR